MITCHVAQLSPSHRRPGGARPSVVVGADLLIRRWFPPPHAPGVVSEMTENHA
jgi:hypothetical protein